MLAVDILMMMALVKPLFLAIFAVHHHLLNSLHLEQRLVSSSSCLSDAYLMCKADEFLIVKG